MLKSEVKELLLVLVLLLVLENANVSPSGRWNKMITGPLIEHEHEHEHEHDCPPIEFPKRPTRLRYRKEFVRPWDQGHRLAFKC